MSKNENTAPPHGAANRRRSETQGLRDLFASQWHHLQSIFERSEMANDALTQDPDLLSDAIESTIEGTDKRIRAIGHYKKKLRNSIGATLNYIDTAVACIPDAIVMNKNNFSHDPQINAFFVNMNDIQHIFSASPILQNFFTQPEHRRYDEAYIVLFSRRIDKCVFGKIIQDDMLVSEVAQIAVNFSDHEIIAAAESEQTIRRDLKEYVFTHIVQYISAYMQQIRRQQQEQIDAGDIGICISGVNNPEVYLHELIQQLSIPGPLLHCKKIPLRLNKMGIEINNDSTETANEFIAHEFRIGQQSPRLVTILRYPRKKMLTDKSLF